MLYTAIQLPAPLQLMQDQGFEVEFLGGDSYRVTDPEGGCGIFNAQGQWIADGH